MEIIIVDYSDQDYDLKKICKLSQIFKTQNTNLTQD